MIGFKTRHKIANKLRELAYLLDRVPLIDPTQLEESVNDLFGEVLYRTRMANAAQRAGFWSKEEDAEGTLN